MCRDNTQQQQQQQTHPSFPATRNETLNETTTMMTTMRTRQKLLRQRRLSFWIPALFMMLFMMLLPSSTRIQSFISADAASAEWKPVVDDESQSDLFEPSSHIYVAGPSQFPKPTRMLNNDTVVPIVEPAFGTHRPHVDAVFAYAEGYTLGVYRMFLETLKATGFTGDVVLAIAEKRIIAPNVEEYLKTHALSNVNENGLGVVVYQAPLLCDGPGNERRVMKQGDTDVFQMCQLQNFYGWKDKDGKVIGIAPDPREGRVVATVRYEFYWVWSLQYNPHSWLMLLDARDSFFQSNPFANLPRDTSSNSAGKDDGLLCFFGENPDATRLGKSGKNLRWLRNGYGDAVLEALQDKPTICSGSTMGETIAVETYLRALVNEHDECNIKMTGSDQGFHNFLYYSGKLAHAESIRRIIVWEQGRGIINNLGALRTKTFADWGIYNEETHQVFQWDGKTLSPVVHQWDRDGHLHKWMTKTRQKEWSKEWEQSHSVVGAAEVR